MGCINAKPAESIGLGPSGSSDVELNKQRETEHRLEVTFKTKRQNVFTAGVNMDSGGLKVKNIPKNDSHGRLIRTALNNIFIFAAMAQDDLLTVVNAMERVEIQAGTDVMTQGTAGDYFYIVEEGSFSVIINGCVVGQLSNGQSFGELALLYDTHRQATIRADSHSVAFMLDRDTFRYIIAHSADSRRGEIQRALSRVPLLSGLTAQQIAKISDSVEICKFEKGEYVIRKGSEGNIFYMVKEGTVTVKNVGAASGQFSDHTLTAGDYFGERALITGEPRAADVIADTNVTVMALDRVFFINLLGPLREVLDYNLNLRIIESIKLFANLTEREKAKVSKSFEYETYTPGTVIIREGDKGRKFYIIKEGTAEVTTAGQEVGQLVGGQYFGELALLDDEVRKATVTATTACECFALDRPTFNKILGSLRDALELEKRERTKMLAKSESKGSGVDLIAGAAVELEFADLRPIAVLGSGTFGRVSLVQNKKNADQVYAMKAMLKSEIEAHKQQQNVMNEKDLMLQCNHTFVLRLYKTFKDTKRLYMLLEFVQGGELFTVLHTPRGDGVPDASAKFYGAGVLLALAHLHQRDIAYRDMKPENCLVDSQGYPKLVDFGFAKVIKNGKSYTLCGTPEYLAPEIVLGRGHDKGVDYWALGILLYEMEAGYSPFSDPQGMDQVVICRNIVNGKLMFPRNFNADCKELVKKLLMRDPATRLGNLRGGVDDIRQHKWFQTFDFDLMLSRGMTAPWIPKIKSSVDTSNFDPMEEADHSDSNYAQRGNWDKDF